MGAAVKLAEGSFTSRIVLERSCSPTVENVGVHTSHLRLYNFGNPGVFCVEWESPVDVVQIGIWTEYPKKVVDYDGVFSLPREIARFLAQQGFDLSGLFDSQPELREAVA